MIYADFSTGICWPSYKTIMDDTKISNPSRIRAAIDTLQREQMIESWINGKRRYYKLLDMIVYKDKQVSFDT